MMSNGARKFESRLPVVLPVLLLSLFVIPKTAALRAQDAIQGSLDFVGASRVEKSSGVWIDGQYVGYLKELKGKKAIKLLPGEHEVVVRQAGYKDFTQKVVVEPGVMSAVGVQMAKAEDDIWPKETAELKLDIKPKRSAVFVDERFLGHAGELGGKFHSMLLGSGKHRIKVELPGYKTFETEVSLTTGQKSVIATELVKGSIKEADPLIKETTRASR